MRRVLPAVMMDKGCDYYDREKYGRLVLEVAGTVLKPFEADPASPLSLDAFKPS